MTKDTAQIMVHRCQIHTKSSAEQEATNHVQKFVKSVQSTRVVRIKEDGAYWAVSVKYTTKGN